MRVSSTPNGDVPDFMDPAGWLFTVNAGQPGSVATAGYPAVVNVYQNSSSGAGVSGQLTTVFNSTVGVGGVRGTFTQFAACSAVLGDPQFSGLLGQSFQVHGVAGNVYNLISDRGLVVNSRFVFLSSGVCPPAAASITSLCWTHPGTYLGELAVVTADGDEVVVRSGSAAHGFDSVSLNGRVLSVGADEKVAGPTTTLLVARKSTHSLHIAAGNWRLVVENSDHFVNLARIAPVHWSAVSSSHGLVGQTWRRPAVAGDEVKEISGRVDDYVEMDGQLTGSRFGFAASE